VLTSFASAAKPDPSDRDLVIAMAAGDANPLRVLTARYAPILTALALRLLNDEAGAEEIAFLALWRVWSEAKSYDPGRGSVGEWLVRIARRRTKDRLRRTNAYRQNGHPVGADSGIAPAVAEPEPIANLLPLAALDRLQPEEQRQLQDHLRQGCDQCEQELRELRESAAALDGPGGSDHKVWQRLEARLHAEAAAAHSLARAVSRPRHLGQDQLRSSTQWWRGVALVALSAAVLLFAYDRIISNRARRNEVRQLEQLESLNWQLNNLRADVTSAQMQAQLLRSEVDAQEKFDRLLMSPDVQVIRLVAAGSARGAAGLIASSYGAHTAMVQALGLPAAPEGRTYVVWWVTRHSGAVKAGMLSPRPDQPAMAPLSMPPSGPRVVLATITLEAAGGTEEPGGPIYLKGSPDRE
jgi:DNA-directed RNA polymerase specialized sigma24 family protein